MRGYSKIDDHWFKHTHDALNALEEVETGWDDGTHSSGLTYATLAAIHSQGWGNCPARNFMETAALSDMMDSMIASYTAQMVRGLVRGENPRPYLEKVGKRSLQTLKHMIKNGQFQPRYVSEWWADYKGFPEAMIETGELLEAAKYFIESRKE